MQKIRSGKFKSKKHKKRLQGQTLYNKSKIKTVKTFFKVVVGLVVLSMIIFGAVVQGVGIQSSGITNNKLKARAEETHPYKSMAVVETSSGRILAGFNTTKRLPMASTTKIATAIVTIESMEDLKKTYRVPDSAVGIEGSSMYLKYGEELSIEEYLYGLMLPSANDSAVALSIIVSGSEENFCKKLNELAEKLDLKNTNFVTASGLHNENHYTSAEDLAKLSAYAMKNETFKKIVSTEKITVSGAEEGNPRHLKNKQKLLFDEELKNAGILVTGIKSGFTPEAGRCLVTSATKNGMEVIAVVLNAPDMFNESKKAILDVYSNYELINVFPPKHHLGTLPVENNSESMINLYTSEGFSYPLTKEERAMIKITYDYPNMVQPPIKKDEVIGEVKITLYGQELFKTEIMSIEEVERLGNLNRLKKIIEKFI